MEPDLVAWRDAETLIVEAASRRRFRLSLRTLMIAVALCALFLAPLGWMYRQVELQRRMEMVAREHARALADERAAALARSAQAVPTIARLGTTAQPKAGNLWAALSVNHPVLKAGQTKDLRIEFSLVNDGDKPIDPKIAGSRIAINGKESSESASVFGGVPKDVRLKALAPGDNLQFSVVLGDYFDEPGTYRVSWKGSDFQSPEISLRVLPEKTR
jgi:hypothetical protein